MAKVPSPAELKAELDRFVIGQEEAKRTLASTISSHYRLVEYQGEVEVGKSNILLVGPTGVGKTHIVQTAARIMQVPFAQTNATAITPSGWAGDDPEAMIRALWKNAKAKKMDWKTAQKGIVYIDEVDKLAVKAEAGPAAAGGFSTVQIQQALLKVVEGTEILIEGNQFSTEQVLFIASGAFIGLDQLITERQAGRFSRSAPEPNIFKMIQSRDLVRFGLIPEFVGRFPIVTWLNALSEVDVVAILRDVKHNLLDQERAKLSVTGCDLEIDEGHLRNIARTALAQGTGARGLRTLLAKTLEPILFDLEPNTLVRITATGVQKDRQDVSSKREPVAEPPLAFTSEPNAVLPDDSSIRMAQ